VRVLYVIDSLSSGGAQRQLVSLVTHLDRADVEPEVAVYHDLDHFRPDLEAADVPVHRIEGRGGRDPTVLRNLAAQLRSGEYDVVHSYLITPGILTRLAAGRLRRHATVVSMRNVLRGVPQSSLLLERALARRAELMIANADAVRRDVEAKLPAWRGRVRVVPNGAGLPCLSDAHTSRARELRAALASEGEFLLGVVGRMELQKNPLGLLDAVALLPERMKERLRIAWVGAPTDTSLVEAVKRRIASEGWEDRVVLLPPTRDIGAFYTALDALVLPSFWEGFPNAVLEALAHGRPAVATDVGDASAMVVPGETGWLVPPEDAGALAQGVLAAMKTAPGRRSAMGEAGRALVQERFSIERLVGNTVAVYAEALERRGGLHDRA
jgi:starch synthase (maltosyl-transferring)